MKFKKKKQVYRCIFCVSKYFINVLLLSIKHVKKKCLFIINNKHTTTYPTDILQTAYPEEFI